MNTRRIQFHEGRPKADYLTVQFDSSTCERDAEFWVEIGYDNGESDVTLSLEQIEHIKKYMQECIQEHRTEAMLRGRAATQ